MSKVTLTVNKAAMVFLLVVGAVCLSWWYFNIHSHIKFYNTCGCDDYAPDSLAEALNAERRWPGGDRSDVSYFQYAHPGIPFELLSWFDFRLATALGGSDRADVPLKVLRDPEMFWLANRLSALALCIIGLYGLWQLSQKSAAVTFTVLLVFFCFQPSWTYGFLRLGIESFALPVAVAFFALTRRAFDDKPHLWLPWTGLGTLGGLAYLMKLNYLMWPMAVMVGLLFQFFSRSISLRQFSVRLSCFGVTLVTTVVGLVCGFLGRAAFFRMLHEHWRILLHTGKYGGGSPGFINDSQLIHNLFNILKHPDLWVAPLVLLILMIVTLVRHRTERTWLKRNLPYVICLTAAVLLVYGAALKHYNEHYLIPAAAVLPLIVIWLGNETTERVRRLLAIVVIGLVGIAAFRQFAQHSVLRAYANAVQQDHKTIQHLPLANGNVRLWSYRVGLPEYQVNQIVSWSTRGSHPLTEFANIYPRDASYDI